MATTYIIHAKMLSKLKEKARKLKQAACIPHHEALERVAKGIGIPNWHLLAESAAITAITETAFKKGMVIAFDAKEGSEFNPGDTFVEDPLAIDFAEPDLVSAYRKACDENGEPATDEDIEEYRHFQIGSHAFFRYIGNERPLSLRQAIGIVTKQSFWSPMYVWLNGDLHETYYEDATNENGDVVGIRI